MNDDFELLAEKEAMWAEMLMQVLKDNGVQCVSFPVYGAGLAIRAGVRERLRVFVPKESRQKALELLEELFPEDADK